jgi:hypothetical protein
VAEAFIAKQANKKFTLHIADDKIYGIELLNLKEQLFAGNASELLG